MHEISKRNTISYFVHRHTKGSDGEMRLQEAINLRILELLQERGWSVNKLAERAGLAPSTLKRMLKPYATIRNSSTAAINRICYGFDIPFKKFWRSPLFNDIDPEPESETD